MPDQIIPVQGSDSSDEQYNPTRTPDHMYSTWRLDLLIFHFALLICWEFTFQTPYLEGKSILFLFLSREAFFQESNAAFNVLFLAYPSQHMLCSWLLYNNFVETSTRPRKGEPYDCHFSSIFSTLIRRNQANQYAMMMSLTIRRSP